MAWCWSYLGTCGGWHSYEDDPSVPLNSQLLEYFYERNPTGTPEFTCGINRKIDFPAMLDTDLTSGAVRRIQRGPNPPSRSCRCFGSVPDFWEPVSPKLPYQLIPLRNESDEYRTVMSHKKDVRFFGGKILKIYRIQNHDLWELYCRKKQQLMRIQQREIEERRLFHGTHKKNVHYICTYNFDTRLGIVQVYGKGVYFATYALLADAYSRYSSDPLPTPNSQPTFSKIMFLARVMVGKVKKGESHFLKPDHDSAENTHDSCVNDPDHPTIYVIFDPNQIYPEYLIEFT